MKQFNFLGLKVKVGQKADGEMTKAEAEAFISKEVEALRKSFTYDKLFTTGHMLDVINSTRVTNPYETIATVYKAVKAICDNVPQAEAALFKREANGKNGILTDDPVFHKFIDNPNPNQNFDDFLQTWVGYFELHGECFIRKTQSLGQQVGTYLLPASIECLNPSYMTEVIDPATDTLTAWRYKNGEILDPKDIIQTKDFNPYNKWRGLAPIKPIFDELQIDNATIAFNLSFFKNDGTPGFAIGTDQSLNDDQRKRLEEWWDKRHKGSRNAFKMAVFEKGLKPLTITPTHKEMDFVSQKDLMRKEILGIWRVPESLFNMTKDINYATFMGQMRVFWIYTLIPVLNKFEATMNRGIINDYNAKLNFGFDLSNVAAFQEQLGDLLKVARDMFDIGYTADEISEKLQLGLPNDKPWRKEGWVPWNMTTAQNAIDNPRISETVNDPTNAPAGDPGGGKTPAKSMDAANKKLRRGMLIKNFNRRQSHVEKLFESKISRYFNELRVQALKTPQIKLEKGIIDINWQKADSDMEKLVQPVMWLAIQAGVAMGKDNITPKKGIEENAINQSLESYLSVKMNRIKDLNATVKDQLESVLTDAIKEGASHSTARDEILSNITDAMKGVFNNAVTRAALIARTETVGAVNGGGLIYYRGIGVKNKSWITAHDDLVRETHAQCEDEGDIPINTEFVNGLKYPGDPNGDAGEVCNCRCVLAPQMDNEDI